MNTERRAMHLFRAMAAGIALVSTFAWGYAYIFSRFSWYDDEGYVMISVRQVVEGRADPLGRLRANYEVLKPQFGLNNPQSLDARFSLRRELFRIGDAGNAESDARWREDLQLS